MKKLMVTLMLGSLWLFSCEGTQDGNQNNNQDADSPTQGRDGDMNQGRDGNMDNMDTTRMDTTGAGGVR